MYAAIIASHAAVNNWTVMNLNQPKANISSNVLRIKEVAEGNFGKMKFCLLSVVMRRFAIFIAAIAVCPLPMNGSKTTSSSKV